MPKFRGKVNTPKLVCVCVCGEGDRCEFSLGGVCIHNPDEITKGNFILLNFSKIIKIYLNFRF